MKPGVFGFGERWIARRVVDFKKCFELFVSEQSKNSHYWDGNAVNKDVYGVD